MSFLLLTLACYSADESADAERYDPQMSTPEDQETDGSVWSARLQANEISSSSRLDLSWNTTQNDNIVLFQLEIIDQITGDSEFLQLDPSQSQVTVENRKAQTSYAINIEACMDEACSLRIAVQDNEIETQTQPQRWVLQGTSVETMNVLAENVGLFSAGSFNYQSSSEGLSDLWTYYDGLLEVYSQTDYEFWDDPSSSCWDSSCFADVQHFQINPFSMLILDSDNTLYSQSSDDIATCSEDCSSTVIYTSEEDHFRDFFYAQDKEVLFWEGLSSCHDDAIFLAQASDDIWRNQLNAEGCPKPLIYSAESPRLVNSGNQDILYFQQMGSIQFIYPKDDINQWEAEEDARSLVLEWENGTEIGENTIRIGKLAFGSAEQLYFSFQPAEVSNDQIYALSVASLENP